MLIATIQVEVYAFDNSGYRFSPISRAAPSDVTYNKMLVITSMQNVLAKGIITEVH